MKSKGVKESLLRPPLQKIDPCDEPEVLLETDIVVRSRRRTGLHTF